MFVSISSPVNDVIEPVSEPEELIPDTEIEEDVDWITKSLNIKAVFFNVEWQMFQNFGNSKIQYAFDQAYHSVLVIQPLSGQLGQDKIVKTVVKDARNVCRHFYLFFSQIPQKTRSKIFQKS